MDFSHWRQHRNTAPGRCGEFAAVTAAEPPGFDASSCDLLRRDAVGLETGAHALCMRATALRIILKWGQPTRAQIATRSSDLGHQRIGEAARHFSGL